MNPALPYKPTFGFTLVELLIVISVIAVISGFVLPNFSGYISDQNVRQAQDQVVTDLRTIQNRALTGVQYDSNKEYWGVRFNPTGDAFRYDYFTVDEGQDLNDRCTNTSVTEISKRLPNDVQIRNTSRACVYFSFDNGNLAEGGAGVPIILGYSDSTGDECLGVTVNSAGYISAATAMCP